MNRIELTYANKPNIPVAIFPQTEYCANGASPDKFNNVIHIEFGILL